MQRQTIIFDFDGVINSYSSGWQGKADIIPDPPVPGIREAIEAIRKQYRIVIVSSRCSHPGGINAIKQWLDKYSIIVDDIQATKPPAYISVDDRAITFDGHPETLLNKINEFQVWNK
jgi:phosphoglycolate phosphatase-like HAD superfamily hydrolase